MSGVAIDLNKMILFQELNLMKQITLEMFKHLIIISGGENPDFW